MLSLLMPMLRLNSRVQLLMFLCMQRMSWMVQSKRTVGRYHTMEVVNEAEANDTIGGNLHEEAGEALVNDTVSGLSNDLCIHLAAQKWDRCCPLWVVKVNCTEHRRNLQKSQYSYAVSVFMDNQKEITFMPGLQRPIWTKQMSQYENQLRDFFTVNLGKAVTGGQYLEKEGGLLGEEWQISGRLGFQSQKDVFQLSWFDFKTPREHHNPKLRFGIVHKGKEGISGKV
eukprot:gnl/MRDRNA2_/MRDRNA2_154461_c0_seq1.p1 gnl/MRDRNA2_/MRDRNA2_154461_c0~~gnl/MRDRNA2_/MRDRNA2_154461_c0_seq1.p1  ORF type:complete len:227 (-),score=41.96 gnl/MRDRNA2_/MRDRNA2_154461_c0_seq1:31-711(-)